MSREFFPVSDRWIRSLRGPKNTMDPRRPYGYFHEEEYQLNGRIDTVNTLLLTNRECRYTCTMCDLWKNTLDETLPPGAIPEQIRWGLSQLPPARHLKLYNASSFFDPAAIPEADYQAIAALVEDFDSVVVENHPRLTGSSCLEFAAMIKPRLQLALGLESIHPGSMLQLNKKMDLEDYAAAIRLLKENAIEVRSFIMLRPPGLNEEDGIHWAMRSLEFAFDCGSDCCTLIPSRAGNGAMEELKAEGFFAPPRLISLEEVHAYGISLNRGPVYADTWDLELFSQCPGCFEARKSRIEAMNLTQKPSSPLICPDCSS